MRSSPAIVRTLVSLACALMLAACGSADDAAVRILAIGESDDPFESCPHLSLPGQLTRAATTEGLVAFDAEGRIIPGLADRWIVTDDGKSYIFRLRDGTWLDGSEITSRSASRALQRAIRALKGTSLGLDLVGIEEIRDMAERVIEIRLERPMPHFLQLLAQPELGLERDGEGGGPMRLVRRGDTAILTPIPPQERGLPGIEDWEDQTRPLHFTSMPGDQAVTLFNRAEADLVLGGRIQNFPLTRSVGILRGTIQLDPVIGLFGLRFMNDRGFLGDPANREAIAMAIDRQALIAPFNLDGWTPSTRIVSPRLDGDLGTIGERWTEMTLENRRLLAAARIAQWREGGEDRPPPSLSIQLPPGPGSDLLFDRIASDLAAVGVEPVRVEADEPADLHLVDDVARYPRATWFLNRLNCKTGRGLCDAVADQRVTEARATDDPAERAALLAEAEAELTEANVFIPLGAPIRWSLVRGNLGAFATNPWGWHPLMPFALRTN